MKETDEAWRRWLLHSSIVGAMVGSIEMHHEQ